jgi:hypothetical protein
MGLPGRTSLAPVLLLSVVLSGLPLTVCWQLQPRPGANVVEAHAHGHQGAGGTVAVVDTGVATAATVVSYRVDGAGGGIPISYLHQALARIATDTSVEVVNLSLGGSQ